VAVIEDGEHSAEAKAQVALRQRRGHRLGDATAFGLERFARMKSVRIRVHSIDETNSRSSSAASRERLSPGAVLAFPKAANGSLTITLHAAEAISAQPTTGATTAVRRDRRLTTAEL
jgi:hypothetical protein